MLISHSRSRKSRIIWIIVAAIILILWGIFLIQVGTVYAQDDTKTSAEENAKANSESDPENNKDTAVWQVDPMKLWKLSNYVVDAAGALSPEQLTALNETSRIYEEQTTNQVAAVLIPHRQWNELADIWLAIFRDTGLGQKDKNNGILLVISTQEKKLRIIVGYGLEWDVPDVLAREIIETSVRPLVDSGMYAEAVQAYQRRVMAAIGTTEWAEAIARDQTTSQEDGVIMAAAFFGFLLGLIGWRVFGGGLVATIAIMIALSLRWLRFGYLLGGIFAFAMKQWKRSPFMFFPGGGFSWGFGWWWFGGGWFGWWGGSSGWGWAWD